MTDKDVGSLFAYTLSALFHSGEHGVAGYGALTIGESADGDVVGHLEPHSLCGIHNTYGSIVVDGEEGVRTVFALQQFGGDYLGIGAVVAEAHQCVVGLNTVALQCIHIPVVAVFGNLECHWRAIECNALASGLNEMGDGVVCALIVVHHHAVGIHTCADAVVEHQWHSALQQLVEVVILGSILGLRHDDAAHLIFIERLAYPHLSLVFLVTLCNHDAIVSCPGLLLDSGKYSGKIVMSQLGYNHPDNPRLHHLTVA